MPEVFDRFRRLFSHFKFQNSKLKIMEDIEEIREPQVTSSIPEERKRARRLRIQKRLDTLRKQVLFTDVNRAYLISPKFDKQYDKTI